MQIYTATQITKSYSWQLECQLIQLSNKLLLNVKKDKTYSKYYELYS